MTGTETEDETIQADRAQTFLDWTRINSKALTAGAVIVVIAAAGYWFYMRSREIQAANADKALVTAKQSMQAGNNDLAQSDLQKVYSRYGSTSAGVQAALLLAELNYSAHKYQDGISVLEKVPGSRAASEAEANIRSLEGDGYAQLGKSAEAAKRYDAAADATTFEMEKAFQRAKAARAYQAAGDTAKARAIWASLATDPKGQTMAAEARVRLGELTAEPAKK